MCRQRRLPSHWFTVLVTLVGIAVVIFCEVRISHIAMHEAAPLPVRTAPSARERPARLGLIARRLVLRADAKYTPRAHATHTPARQQHCGKSGCRRRVADERTWRTRSSSTPWANWHLIPYGQAAARIQVAHSSVCQRQGFE